MDLQQFIESALSQIIQGVAAAQHAAAEHGGVVNPAFSQGKASDLIIGSTSDHVRVFEVRFDVAVTATEDIEAGATAKIRIAGLPSAGAGAGASSRTESVSRLQFVVPVVLPEDTVTRAAADESHRREQAQVEAHNADVRARSSAYRV